MFVHDRVFGMYVVDMCAVDVVYYMVVALSIFTQRYMILIAEWTVFKSCTSIPSPFTRITVLLQLCRNWIPVVTTAIEPQLNILNGPVILKTKIEINILFV